jgi:hypothetical protein
MWGKSPRKEEVIYIKGKRNGKDEKKEHRKNTTAKKKKREDNQYNKQNVNVRVCV